MEDNATVHCSRGLTLSHDAQPKVKAAGCLVHNSKQKQEVAYLLLTV